jgi:DNA-binding response OmpR family regulator
MNQFKVLVAETNPLVGDNIRAVLQRFGLVCHLLPNHDKVLSVLGEQSFDLIILDADAEGIDYQDIVKKIRSGESLNGEQLPVMALTSNLDAGNIEALKTKGFTGHIIKPLDLSDLKFKLAENLPSFSADWDDENNGKATDENEKGSSYDLNYLIEYAGGDMDFVNELIRYFIDESPKVIQGLKSAHQKGNWDEMRMIAHKYSPQMTVMGLNKCAGILAAIENNTRNGIELQELPELIFQFETHCKTAVDNLGRELDTRKTKKHRVLVCEDDQMMLRLIEHKMLKSGFEIVVARDGKDAAQLLMKEDFSLVITDLLMPYITGLELITLLRSKLNKQTPIIVLSRIGLENTVLKAFDLGADDYVVKPFSPNELMIRAKKLVSK